jgi:UMF1 family MFS transporter
MGIGSSLTHPYSLYTNSISVGLQALTVISLSSIADQVSYRKPLLLTFAAVGYLPAIAFLFLSSDSSIWLLAAPLAILANVGFGVSIVAMNAYLPGLARESPDVVKLKTAGGASTRSHTSERPDGDDLEDAPLLGMASAGSIPPAEASVPLAGKPDEYSILLSQTTSRISSMGIASGYGAGRYLTLNHFIWVDLAT